ncbi:MAG: excinuclease ABC subunit UvrA, partial [Muribaculaceae bacterium]|nr:excinuclease ABC subunit UvrA [Muribaculaceae bacterium]
SYPEGVRVAVTSPIILPAGRDLKTQLDIFAKEGYNRLLVQNRFVTIEDFLADPKKKNDEIFLVIDRLSTSRDDDEMSRLAESVETAFFEGHDSMRLYAWDGDEIKHYDFSKRFEADGITFMEPNDQMFNFNNPFGACPRCEGFGKTMGIDENLVIPNQALSVYEDAVVCWRGEKMSEWKKYFMRHAPSVNFPIHKPYNQLTQEQKDLLWHGDSSFEGIDGFFKMLEDNLYKIQNRVMLARYRGKTVCPVCHGNRLRPEAQYIKIAGATITDLVKMPITNLLDWFENLELDSEQAFIAGRLLTEIKNRLSYMINVGLGYLTLDRLSNTLSGGESQRINLATSLGSSLVGSLYILDEPSIGLHSRDTGRLIDVLKQLRDLGNTVIVVEHDEEIMKAADYIVDVGPLAGRLGGEIVFQGTQKQLAENKESLTSKYLDGTMAIPLPVKRRKWNSYIEIKGASENNLKDIDVKFPLGVMTVVTGVSGSGKSTLVRDILYRALVRHLGEAGNAPGAFKSIGGDLNRIKGVDFVDQNPIGKSSRSNPATYLKAYDEIRQLFASQQLSKQMGYTPSTFSFNAEGGRCEECKGEGTITIEMQFMADITIPCDSCHGKRFKKEVLEVKYRDKSIDDILNMTVNNAIEFFSEVKGTSENKIVKRLKPLQDVGLGYIKLGQSSSTLSGGENQRVKLAYYLADERIEPTLFIFDEPTTGLHFHDINKLMESFNRLIANGHTIVIIEHNMDVVKCADHVIDMGPDGGDGGGTVVATGTPEDIVKAGKGFTFRYLAEKL